MSPSRAPRCPRPARLAATGAVLVAVTACGGSPSSQSAGPYKHTVSPSKTVRPVPVEKNPPGDIPDNLAFVKDSNRAGGYAFRHPEGWVKTTKGTRVRFTDKLNGVTVESQPGTSPPTVATARATEVPALRSSEPAFQLVSISAAKLPGGSGVHIVFRRNSDPDPVTGKVYRDEVEEYLVLGSGRLVRMDLYGPVGADNVDAYRTMSQSLSTR